MAATVRIGTCSWADEALSEWFYPPKLPAKERLAWYAEHFDTVEVDSTYYRLPGESMVQGWAERTPDGFTMHVKAFGLMTRHPVKAEAIPEDLRAEMPVDERGRVDRPPRELRGEVFRRFLDALEPLRRTGKLGGILFQLPSYVVFKEYSLDYLYSDEELGEWVAPLQELAGEAEQAFAFFNNNSSSPDPENPLGRMSQAAANARQLRRLLDAARVPATGAT